MVILWVFLCVDSTVEENRGRQRVEFARVFDLHKGADGVHFRGDDVGGGVLGEGTQTLGEEGYGGGVGFAYAGFIQGGDEFGVGLAVDLCMLGYVEECGGGDLCEFDDIEVCAFPGSAFKHVA